MHLQDAQTKTMTNVMTAAVAHVASAVAVMPESPRGDTANPWNLLNLEAEQG